MQSYDMQVWIPILLCLRGKMESLSFCTSSWDWSPYLTLSQLQVFLGKMRGKDSLCAEVSFEDADGGIDGDF